ncbi:hypothetical protein IFM58399_00730 [Aspergillus lentulus]|uniref:uncharacterized protein n=1 Tax=Aspergillus lentulus TaxID=293939 RepID=UPI001395498A|nr:uncharacterized protein IFM58399_00730 [Aspergillus lentulus]GFF24620.1 hypothetical protein IFM58399_00730 [Aspergillus lentulus]
MHKLLRVPYRDNPTVPFISPRAGHPIKQSPLLAIGTLDQEGRPWSTIWGGTKGFATPTSASTFDIKTPIGVTYDPVVESLLLDSTNNSGKLVSFLAVDLENHQRVKLHGRVAAGSLDTLDVEARVDVAHLIVHIDGSLGEYNPVNEKDTKAYILGNCPKYLNAKHILPAPPDPKLISKSPQLHLKALTLLHRADCFFISPSHGREAMGTNIRGGPPGFVRIVSNEPSGGVFIYPEYSGNRLYQTLGNLQISPLAGFVFPDFGSGDALFITGRTEILIGKDASSVLPRSNIAVRVTITSARFLEKALAFRGIPGKPSPYNPSVRYLITEKTSSAALADRESTVTATLIRKEIITPSIGRFRFRLSDKEKAGPWSAGQYATFSFQNELDMGYRHMNDSDPSSLNDDFVRTFTISSCPGYGIPDGEFEITARRNGKITNYLFRESTRVGLEVPLKGFGGDFSFKKQSDDGILPFVAGGIGITPVLAQLPTIDIRKLRLLWSISIEGIALVVDAFRRFPGLPCSTTVFITELSSQHGRVLEELEAIDSSGALVYYRRMGANDIDLALADTWYFCGSPSLRVPVLDWLAGKDVVYEDFDY